jgi:uncharacterized DUF497 family protein
MRVTAPLEVAEFRALMLKLLQKMRVIGTCGSHNGLLRYGHAGFSRPLANQPSGSNRGRRRTLEDHRHGEWRLLVLVAYIVNEKEQVIRIIAACKVTRQERIEYEEANVI